MLLSVRKANEGAAGVAVGENRSGIGKTDCSKVGTELKPCAQGRGLAAVKTRDSFL